MKKIIIVSLLIVACFIIVGISLFRQKVGDVRPMILPPAKKANSTSQLKESNAPLTVPEGFAINYFSKRTPGARDLQISLGGALLVSLPGQGKVVALPDFDNNGEADEVKVILDNLRKPHGIAFYPSARASTERSRTSSGQVWLFVAEETQVNRYSWDEANLKATFDKKILDLPAGGRHSTRTMAIEKDGTLYVSLGSTCDTCFEKHPFIAAVIISTTEGKKPEVFAKGLRNAVFLKLDSNEKLWGTEMGRDFLGDSLPPDEINLIERGGDYGWPVCYGEQVYDAKFGVRDPSYCKNTLPPAFKLPAHVAPLGLSFINSDQFPDDYQDDLLVALHGSWNSSVPVGYKVVRLKLSDLSNIQMEDFITGFTGDSSSNVIGRPVDVEFGREGELYISDDKADAIYRVTAI